MSPVIKNVNKTVNTHIYILYAPTVEMTTRYTENKEFTVIGAHMSKVIICKENNKEAKASASKKMLQFCQTAQIYAYLICANMSEVRWALFEERSLSGSVKPQS